MTFFSAIGPTAAFNPAYLMHMVSRLAMVFTIVAAAAVNAYPRQAGTVDYVPGTIVYKLERTVSAGLKGTADGAPANADVPDLIDEILQAEQMREQVRVMPDNGFREARMSALNRGLRDWQQMPEDLTRTFVVTYDSGESPYILAAKLASLPGIEYAEPLYIHEITASPNDPFVSGNGHDYFGYHAFFGAWNVSKSSEDVVIAIIDSGVDYTHVDLRSKLWRNPEPGRARSMFPDLFSQVENDTIGWDFWSSGTTQNPVQGNDPRGVFENHGTHVAGTAAANTDNAIGIAGTGWNARYMAVKAGGTQEFPRAIGFGYQGILYAAANGADIINCSWGGSNFSLFGQDVVSLATAMGSLVVGAAGNSGSDQFFYPAALPEVLSVGSVDHRNGLQSGFSNYGYSVDVFAAGTVINSTIFNNDYGLKSGTSMAAPVVSGLAALLRSHFPDWSPMRIATQIRATATSIDADHPASFRYKLGTGVVNAYRALTTNRPGVKVINTAFLNLSGDKLDLGEEGEITIRLKNYGEVTSQLDLFLEPLTSGIEISKVVPHVTMVATDTEITAKFNIKIPTNYNLSTVPGFLLRIEDRANSYSDFAVITYDSILFDIHSSNKILTSVNTTGTVGYLDALSASGGVGFIPFNESTGDFSNPSVLFEGALMIETFVDSVGYNLDQARNDVGISRDFVPLSGFQFQRSPDPSLPTIGRGRFTTLQPGNRPHLDIELETFSYNQPDLDQAMIFRYSVTNLSNGRLNTTRIGLFNDWDIIPYFDNNTAFDLQGDFIYAWSSQPGQPYTAVAHLGTIESALAIDNRFNGPQDSLNFGLVDGFSDQKKSWSLRAGRTKTVLRNTDISIVTSSGPFDIEPEATAVIGFIYAYGNSLADLRLQIQNAREKAGFRVSSPGLVLKDEGPFSEIPESTLLYSNYPNPFNPSTTVRYYMDEGAEVNLSVYDLLGRLVTTLARGPRAQGSHTVSYNAAGLSSGVYLLVLDAGGKRQTRKMLLLK
ncbi:MAG: S8 family peptidase [Rhodothermaceae bacterium]|nr:S8 family peptidase [Rhodothermaceae bacterium]